MSLIQSLLLESNPKDDSSNIISFTAVFYTHILKWKYQPSHQNDSWIESIVNSYKEIKKLACKSDNKIKGNIKQKVDPQLFAAYLDGLGIAIKETGISEIQYDITKSTTIDPTVGFCDATYFNFNTIESLVVFDRIIDWLYLYTPNTKYQHKGFDTLKNNSYIRQNYNGRYKNNLF